jgi:hypothetical protein
MLWRRSMGPSSRLASWRRALRRRDGGCRAVVIERKRNCSSESLVKDYQTPSKCSIVNTFQVAVATKLAIDAAAQVAGLPRRCGLSGS